ncbi:hypothetical protein YC2023_053758 [Brassica napus]
MLGTSPPEEATVKLARARDKTANTELSPQDDNYYGRRDRSTRRHSQELGSERQRHQKRRGCSLVTRHALSRKPPNPGDNTERGSSQHAPTTENQPQDLTLAKRIRTSQETETQTQPRRDLAEGRRKMKNRRD